MIRILNLLASLNFYAHGGMVLGAFGYFQFIKAKLDASYAASNHPVDYATGQTAFSGEAIKGYYAHMQDLGTLDIYLRTQIIDFGFILGMILMGALLGSFVMRFAAEESWARKLAMGAGISVICGALCDVMENLISFVMLTDPQGFADWLALPYSGFAVVKFALITLGMALLLASLVAGSAGWAMRKRTA